MPPAAPMPAAAPKSLAAPKSPAGAAVSRRQMLGGVSATVLSTAALALPGTDAVAASLDPTLSLAALPEFKITGAQLTTVLASLRVVCDASPSGGVPTAAAGEYVTFGLVAPVPGEALYAAALLLLQSIPPQAITWKFERVSGSAAVPAPHVVGPAYGPSITALFPFDAPDPTNPATVPSSTYRATATIAGFTTAQGPMTAVTKSETSKVDVPSLDFAVSGLSHNEVRTLVQEAFKLETPKLQIPPGAAVPLAVVPTGPEDAEWVAKTAEMVKPAFEVDVVIPLDDVFKPVKAITKVGTGLLDFVINKVTLITGTITKITGTALGGIGLAVSAPLKLLSQVVGIGARAYAELAAIGGKIGEFITGKPNHGRAVRDEILSGGQSAERALNQGVNALTGLVRDVDRTIDELLDVSALQNLTGALEGAFNNLAIPLTGAIRNENFTTGLVRPEDDDPTYKARKGLPTVPSLGKRIAALDGVPDTANFLRVGHAVLPLSLLQVTWPATSGDPGVFYLDHLGEAPTSLSRTLAFTPPANAPLVDSSDKPGDMPLGPLRRPLKVTLRMAILPVQVEQDQRKLAQVLTELPRPTPGPDLPAGVPVVDASLETALLLLPFDYDAVLSKQIEVHVPSAPVAPGASFPVQIGVGELFNVDVGVISVRRTVGVLSLDVTLTPNIEALRLDKPTSPVTTSSTGLLDHRLSTAPPVPAYSTTTDEEQPLPPRAETGLVGIRVTVDVDLAWSV